MSAIGAARGTGKTRAYNARHSRPILSPEQPAVFSRHHFMSDERYRILRKLAWWYTAGFLGIFLVCHTPGLSDDQGRLLGLFRIDPIDDFVHLLSGIAGAVIAWTFLPLIPAYFVVVGVLYNLDAVVGMTMSRGLLDLSVFTLGPAGPDFSLTNWLLNLPHIVLATLALIIGVVKPGVAASGTRS